MQKTRAIKEELAALPVIDKPEGEKPVDGTEAVNDEAVVPSVGSTLPSNETTIAGSLVGSGNISKGRKILLAAPQSWRARENNQESAGTEMLR